MATVRFSDQLKHNIKSRARGLFTEEINTLDNAFIKGPLRLLVHTRGVIQ